MTDHIKTRSQLRSMIEVKTFSDLMDRCIMSPLDRQIMDLHYLEERDFRYIADQLGYTEGAIKKRHRKILNRIKHII